MRFDISFEFFKRSQNFKTGQLIYSLLGIYRHWATRIQKSWVTYDLGHIQYRAITQQSNGMRIQKWLWRKICTIISHKRIRDNNSRDRLHNKVQVFSTVVLYPTRWVYFLIFYDLAVIKSAGSYNGDNPIQIYLYLWQNINVFRF